MKKYIFGGIIVCLALVVSIPLLASAARNDSAGCNADDKRLFPYGFLCGTSPEYYVPLQQEINNITSGNSVRDGSVNVNEGDVLSTEAGFTFPSPNGNGPRRNGDIAADEILVWATINTNSKNTSDALAFSGISGNGNSGIACPGDGGSGPGKVYGYRDIGGNTYNSSVTNGDDQSPLAYNNDTGRGVVNCQDSGRMVYWTDTKPFSSPGFSGYRFNVRMPDVPTNINICMRINVSVRFTTDVGYFPPQSASTTPDRQRDQNYVASHIVKQSTNKCFDVQNVRVPPPPSGTLVARCESSRVTTSSADYNGRYNTRTAVTSSGVTPSINTAYVAQGTSRTFNYLPDNNSTNGVSVTRNIEYQYSTNAGIPANGRVVGNWYDVPNQSSQTDRAGPCYSAGCTIYGIDANAPNGNVRPGSTFRVNALVYNNGSADLRAYFPVGGNRLQLQNSGGGVGSFATRVDGLTLTNPGYYEYVSFDVTAPASGASAVVSAQVAFENRFFMGTTCTFTVDLYEPPILQIDGTNCVRPSVFGWAYTKENSGASIFVDISEGGTSLGRFSADQLRQDVNNAFSIGGSHGYEAVLASSLQDGSNKTFTVSAYDQFGNVSSASQDITMTGCGRYHLRANATNGALAPTPEDPSSFSGGGNVRATYDEGWSGPASGVGDATASYRYTVKGGQVSGDNYPDTRFINRDYTFAPTPIAPGFVAGDDYCYEISVRSANGVVRNDGLILDQDGQSSTSQKCDDIHNKPYTKTYGGSVSAGGAFAADTANPNANEGQLGGWNNNTTSHNYGSGSQLSALAVVKIVGYASAQTVATRNPTSLSFANNNISNITPSIDSPGLGGDFGGSYFLHDLNPAKAASATAFGGSDSLNGKNGVYKASAAQTTISGGNIGPGKKVSVFADGDVYITNNIEYVGNWANQGQIPIVNIRATGNIYIAPNVTQLDGIYIATGTGEGRIFTCSNGFSPVAAASVYDTCRNQLTVNGSFVANKVNMMRTYGSLRDDKPVAAAGATSGVQWSHNGPIAGQKCTRTYEDFGNEPLVHTWVDNYICVPNSSPLNFRWTHYSNNPGPTFTNENKSISVLTTEGYGNCVYWNAGGSTPADPNTWQDNALCANLPTGFTFEYSNTSSATKRCTQIFEPSDPDGLWERVARGGYWLCEPIPQNNAAPALPRNNCSNQGARVTTRTCAAEVFNFSPEMYLWIDDSSPGSTTVTGPGNEVPTYNSITSLPPVL